jgi:hypothetical protein
MKSRILSFFLLLCSLASFAQNEDAAGSIALTPVAMATYTSAQWALSNCSNVTYNLGNSVSPQPSQAISGLMNNDVWFHFVAVAEVAKIKVCSPTFDVSIELWNSTATGTAIAARNNTGNAQKEVLCASSLTVGATYKVRVGRANGTGAGTFTILYEHLGISLTPAYSPDPPGSPTCYNFATGMNRTNMVFSVGQTRWKLIAADGTVFGPYLGTYQFKLEQGPEICETVGSLTVFVEIQATDIDCGNIWWGFSEGRPINVCSASSLCPNITFTSPTAPCGGVICDIYYKTLGLSYVGTGFQYQYRFVTDNGQTEFTTAWSTSPLFSTATAPYTNYFRYGKVYQAYVRVKRCDNNPPWCGPCTFTTCGFPYANITPVNATSGLSNYCLWRNKTGPSIEANVIVGMDQYRFRLMPVDPCSSNPFTPIGAAITTSWSYNYYITPAYWPITAGQVYILQAQCRVLPATFTNSSGQSITIPGQQSDWGWPCFIGFRSSSSPAAGSPVQCCSFPLPSADMLPNEFFNGESKWTEFTEWTEEPMPSLQQGSITIMKADGNEIQMDLTESNLFGNAQCEIYAISGKLIESHPLQAVHESNFVSITTEKELAGGIYLITVYTPTGRVSQKFFVAN